MESNYGYLHGPTQFVCRDFSLKDARTAFKILKREKLVEFTYGMKEDSDLLCGSGYNLTREARVIVQDYLIPLSDRERDYPV